MMYTASSSIGEVPYCFSRSSVQFQGHLTSRCLWVKVTDDPAILSACLIVRTGFWRTLGSGPSTWEPSNVQFSLKTGLEAGTPNSSVEHHGEATEDSTRPQSLLTPLILGLPGLWPASPSEVSSISPWEKVLRLKDWSRSGGSYGNNTLVICCPAGTSLELRSRDVLAPDNKSRGCCCRNSLPTVYNPNYNMTKQRCMKRIYDKIHPKPPTNLATSPTCLHCDVTHLSFTHPVVKDRSARGTSSGT